MFVNGGSSTTKNMVTCHTKRDVRSRFLLVTWMNMVVDNDTKKVLGLQHVWLSKSQRPAPGAGDVFYIISVKIPTKIIQRSYCFTKLLPKQQA